ncbi:hypothetical protein [Streptomyces sp. SID10815]|uniref:hypothetical protein n=1 Tax=Streptomyces sp. SID10815 TaxID=2706027 RepID=UPI0013C574D4|nr:hypothetical protein [Streptomyces sp. SID10815]NEA52393.1 hypothetical protein [Streptomyces sp. SID10815]
MAAAIIAAAAALAGVLLQSLIGDWRARSERRRRDLADAVQAVLRAFVDFRAQQYLKIAARRDGIADTLETRRERYQARSDLTAAIDQLHTATSDPRLLAAAETARQLAVALGDAAIGTGVDEAQVTEIGEQARQAHTALRAAAARTLHS